MRFFMITGSLGFTRLSDDERITVKSSLVALLANSVGRSYWSGDSSLYLLSDGNLAMSNHIDEMIRQRWLRKVM